MTGVWPRGAQVRRTTGRSDTHDSSQNTTTARRRRALRRILGPVLGHPAGDRPLVTLHRAAGGALQPVVQPVAQQLPHVAGMVGDPGELLDHAGDAGKGPVVAVEAVRAGTLGLGMAGGKQLAGLHADAFERLAVARTAGVAAVGGWSHTAMLPECRRNARTSLISYARIILPRLSESQPRNRVASHAAELPAMGIPHMALSASRRNGLARRLSARQSKDAHDERLAFRGLVSLAIAA